jgi:polyhydroxyalkanoate synthesis regulator phasin
MNNNFEEKVTSQLESMTTQIESMTTKMQSITTQIESIAISIGNLATKDELNIAVSKLATKDELNDLIDGLAFAVKKGFDEVHEKIGGLERKVERSIEDFTNQLNYLNLWSPTKREFMELDDRVKVVERKIKV